MNPPYRAKRHRRNVGQEKGTGQSLDNAEKNHDSAAAVLAHIVWALGVIAVTWTGAIWVGITTFQPTAFAFFRDLNYSATIAQGLWLLGLVLAALHFAVHSYRGHATDRERFPGQLWTLAIPPALRWMRVVIFLAMVAAPTAAYVFFAARMFGGLSIVHNGGKATDEDTKKDFELLTDWGLTYRPEGRMVFRGWHWYSWNDDRKICEKCTGADAWPGFQPTLYGVITIGLVISLGWLSFRPVPERKSHSINVARDPPKNKTQRTSPNI